MGDHNGPGNRYIQNGEGVPQDIHLRPEVIVITASAVNITATVVFIKNSENAPLQGRFFTIFDE